MSISGISSSVIQSQWIQQQMHVSQGQQGQQGGQTSKTSDGDGDHGIEPSKGQHINTLG